MCGIIHSTYWPLSRGVKIIPAGTIKAMGIHWKRSILGKIEVRRRGQQKTRWDGEGARSGGSGWGTHVNPWLIHVSVWQKPLQKRWLDDITNSMDVSLNKLKEMRTGKSGMLQSIGSQKVGHGWLTKQQQWTFRKKIEPWSSVHLRVNLEHGLWN